MSSARNVSPGRKVSPRAGVWTRAQKVWQRHDLRARAAMGVALAASSAFPLALLALRARLTASFGFAFLVWNLFLAWVPLGFALVVEMGWRRHWRRTTLLLPLGAWLVFFPNAPYLITDLVHLSPNAGAPLWFDALVLVSMAVAGLMVGFVSLHLVQLVVTASFGRVAGWIASVGVLGVSGFGIYLGRFARYNSWDILGRPRELLYDVKEVTTEPLSNGRAVGVSAVFTAFLVVTYLAIIAVGRIGLPERDVEADPRRSE